MKLSIVAGLCLLPLLLAAAQPAKPLSGDEIRERHRTAAKQMLDTMAAGVKLSGTVSENGSPGTFQAWFKGDTSIVREEVGDIVNLSYDGPKGVWSGSNYSLPYELDAAGNPANACIELLSSGRYLEEPYWDKFTFIEDVAGGYHCRFAPDGMPPADVTLNSDPSDPNFLQLSSAEIRFAPSDPQSDVYRSFYFYGPGKDGKLYMTRETGRELDSAGETAGFSEYTVQNIEHFDELPAEASFNFDRVPPAAAHIDAPVDIPVETGNGYFVLPLTFAGSDKTWMFILDTGAATSLFTPEAAAASGLTTDLGLRGNGHGSHADLQVGLCKTASVGRAEDGPEKRAPLAPFPAARLSGANADVLQTFGQYNVGGILGVDLLHQYVGRFDLFGKKVTLIPPQQFDGTALPRPNLEIWLDVEDLIYLTGYISDGQHAAPLRGPVVLDTGMQQRLSVLGETMDANGLKFDKAGTSKSTVLGGERDFDHVRVPRFDIATLSWTDVDAAVTSDDKGTLTARGLLGFVGVPFFDGSLVTIDLFNQRLYAQPLPADEQQQFNQERQKYIDSHKGQAAADKSETEPAAPKADDNTTTPDSDKSDDGPRSKDDVDRDRLRDLDKPKPVK